MTTGTHESAERREQEMTTRPTRAVLEAFVKLAMTIECPECGATAALTGPDEAPNLWPHDKLLWGHGQCQAGAKNLPVFDLIAKRMAAPAPARKPRKGSKRG